MSWKNVGEWIKDNAAPGAALVGSLLTGNVPGAVAAGVSLVSSATGTDNPAKALEALQSNPETQIKLKELYYQNESSVRSHIENMARIELEQDENTQQTIRNGDNATDEYVRRTRPKMARESWFATITYALICILCEIFLEKDIFNIYVAGILSAPAFSYLGLRSFDKLGYSVKNALTKEKPSNAARK